ncbi:MAG: calcium/proton exchanger [Gemmatimonadetes bacterium]|nr:calcium/proton exchanger [Gemmatimonadota bacterium]
MLLLVFVPAALALRYVFHADPTWIFVMSAVAIIPLAGLLGLATEKLADHFGVGVGGLLNATFGNAAELIISVIALRAGMHDLVKASITGSIIGNILFVFGLSALFGGLKYHTQTFNRTAASMGATLLLLSAVGLVVPAIFHGLVSEAGAERELSLEIAVVLMATYLLSLVFTLKTHSHLYSGATGAGAGPGADDALEPVGGEGWSKGKALLVLVGAAAAIGWLSELLVGAVQEAGEALGMTEVFLGVVVIALIGNAAEHSTAVLMALKNKMDLALHIAIGSSIQIALFVGPLLVFLSYVIGPAPMDLHFTSLEVLAVALSVLIISQVADDGKSHWMEGVQLVAVYAILALAFFHLPA